MKLFAFLLVLIVAIHSCSGTFRLAKRIVEQNVANADALVKKVLNSGTSSSNLEPLQACSDCLNQPVQHTVLVRPSNSVKGRYYYYPTSYYYPSTAYYYYPSYSVQTNKNNVQRRVSLQGSPNVQGFHGLYGPNFGIGGYFVYPAGYNSQRESLKSQQVRDFYQPTSHPLQFAPVVPVSVSGYPSFSKFIRQKTGRPFVPATNHISNHDHKGGQAPLDPIKGGSTTTTESTTDPIEQQHQEQEHDDASIKGYYSQF